MDFKYPHWYHQDGPVDCCCPDEYMVNCCEEVPGRTWDFHRESLKDRILCLLGCEVIFSVDARICSRESQTLKSIL